MRREKLTTPVLFLIFRRPDLTERVFNEIKKAKPAQLFISADGPREGYPEETKLCQAARDIVKQVDWECDVHTNFRDANMGLKLAMSSGINWFFDNVEEGIILEDDCLPSQSFFWFCEGLLKKYRDDQRIMSICGNYQFGKKEGEASYYFSRIANVWGWASWRRAWRHFDLGINSFPKFKAYNRIRDVFNDKLSSLYFMTKIEDVYKGANSWAFSWVYSVFTQNGLCIHPSVNLVTNIGFGKKGAIHATDPTSQFSNVGTGEIDEIIHPEFILPDNDADNSLMRIAAREQMPRSGVFSVVKRVLKKIWRKIQ